jgi:hypothetical protein
MDFKRNRIPSSCGRYDTEVSANCDWGWTESLSHRIWLFERIRRTQRERRVRFKRRDISTASEGFFYTTIQLLKKLLQKLRPDHLDRKRGSDQTPLTFL